MKRRTETVRHALLVEIDEFLRETQMTQSELGRRAVGNKSFVARLQDPDRSVMAATVDKVRAYMAAYRAKHGRKVA